MAEHQITTVIIYRSTRCRSRDYGHNCLYARISELLGEGTDPHLVQVFRNKKRLWRRFNKLPSGRVERLDGWLADVIEHFAYLWEASQEDNRWTVFGSLHLGVLKTANRGIVGGLQQITCGNISSRLAMPLAAVSQLRGNSSLGWWQEKRRVLRFGCL